MIGFFVAPHRRHRRSGGAGGVPDTTPPVLSSLVIDEGNLSVTVDSDEFGLLRWLVDGTSSYADAAALAAALPSGEASGLQAVTPSTNTVSLDVAGATPGTWRVHVGVTDGAGNASNVLSGNLTIISSSLELELDGDPLEWNGDQLIFNAA